MNGLAKILLVEDNEDDVFAFRRAMNKAGCGNPLQVVTDGQKAVDYLGGGGQYADRTLYPLPHLLFLDLKLPYLSGHEVFEWLRSQAPLGSIPVVILSGSDEDRDHSRADGNGALAYLLKPPSPSELGRVISQVESSIATARD